MPYYPPASAGGVTFPITGTGDTVTSSTPIVDLSQTWNSGAVTFVGKKTNITNTASAAASLIEDWQVGGSSVMALRKDGRLALTSATPALYVIGQSGTYPIEVRNAADTAHIMRVAPVTGDVNIAGTFESATGFRATAFGAYCGVSGINRFLFQNGYIEVRNGSDVERLRFSNTGLRLTEATAPSSPASNTVEIYAEDNGSGKTRIMALFATGAAQQIAIEP